jgi:hypothetical protein
MRRAVLPVSSVDPTCSPPAPTPAVPLRADSADLAALLDVSAAQADGPLALAPVEELHVVYLDNRMRLMDHRRMFVGSDMCVVVEPREILRVALLLRARVFALAHNHPSGDPEPSAQDLALTRRLAELCALMGMELVDHIVVGRPQWVSMRRDGHFQPRSAGSPTWMW